MRQQVNLTATILGQDEDNYSITADRMTAGSFVARGMTSRGAIRLHSVKIESQLSLQGANLAGRTKDGWALVGDRAHVADEAFLDHLRAPWPIRLIGARFEAGLNTSGSRISGLVLDHGDIRDLRDAPESWPPRGMLSLEGCRYGTFAEGSPQEPGARIQWLDRLHRYSAQPYEHLVDFYRRLGWDSAARQVAIAKQEAIRREPNAAWWTRIGRAVLRWTVGYGYRPWRALYWFAGLGLVGWFGAAIAQKGAMVPARSATVDASVCESTYPCLEPLAYALDVLLPIIDLQQSAYWLPDRSAAWGWAFWLGMWILTLAGWGLTTILVAAFTGIIKKD